MVLNQGMANVASKPKFIDVPIKHVKAPMQPIKVPAEKVAHSTPSCSYIPDCDKEVTEQISQWSDSDEEGENIAFIHSRGTYFHKNYQCLPKNIHFIAFCKLYVHENFIIGVKINF